MHNQTSTAPFTTPLPPVPIARARSRGETTFRIKEGVGQQIATPSSKVDTKRNASIRTENKKNEELTDGHMMLRPPLTTLMYRVDSWWSTERCRLAAGGVMVLCRASDFPGVEVFFFIKHEDGERSKEGGSYGKRSA